MIKFYVTRDWNKLVSPQSSTFNNGAYAVNLSNLRKLQMLQH